MAQPTATMTDRDLDEIEATRPFLAPVPATPAQIIQTQDSDRDLRDWEANEIGAPADERFAGGR